MRQYFTHFALGAYLVAQVLPAFTLAGDLTFGWKAVFLSGVGTYGALRGGVLNERGYTTACLTGFSANLTFIAALVAAYWGTVSRARRLGQLALGCGAASVIVLLFSSERFVPNIGCGLWLMTMAMLAFHRVQPKPATLSE